MTSEAERSWHLSLLAETEAGRRNRRTIDAAFLLVAAIVIGLTAVVASSAEKYDREVAHALQTVLAWADSLWRFAFIGLLVFALLAVVEVVLRRRWSLARDILVAVLLVVGAGFLLDRLVESDWVPVEGHLLSNWGYPELRLATAAAILVVAGPELVRWARLLAAGAVPFASVGAVVLGSGLPAATLGALALALGSGAIVRLTFGSAAGVPPTARVRGALAALGVEVEDLTLAARQRVGYAEYVGRDAQGPLKVRALAGMRRTRSGSRGAGASSPTETHPGASRSGVSSRSSTRASRSSWRRRQASACRRSSSPRSDPRATRSWSPVSPMLSPWSSRAPTK